MSKIRCSFSCAIAGLILCASTAPSPKHAYADASSQETASPAVAATESATSPHSDTGVYDPATTTVAILPVVDRTGEKVIERRKRQEWTGYYNIAELFHERNFKLASPLAVKKAITDQNLDLQDEEAYRRDNFYKIADAVHADLVVFVAVMESREDRKRTGIFGNDKNAEIQGRATVKTWLLDAKQRKAIISAVQNEGKAAGVKVGFDTNAGTRRRANAVGNAIKEQLEDFFAPYKKTSSSGLSDWVDLPQAEANFK